MVRASLAKDFGTKFVTTTAAEEGPGSSGIEVGRRKGSILEAGPDRRQREPPHSDFTKKLTRCAPLPRRCWWVGRSHDVEALRNTMTGERCGAWREKTWGEVRSRCRHGPEGGATGPKDCRALWTGTK